VLTLRYVCISSISLTWNNAILLNHHSLFRENSEKPLRSSAESHVSPKKVGCFVRGTPKSSVDRWDFPWNKPSIGIIIPALKINKSLKPPIAGWFIHGKSQSKMDDEMGYPHFRKPWNVSTITPTLGLFSQPTGTNCFGAWTNGNWDSSRASNPKKIQKDRKETSDRLTVAAIIW